ncbi:NAD(P)/FAD-dependent oxidoreductase [Phormidium sp. CCY1219]|uniref:NAD(P)/FAD-dependent oxidoreductase n=1 Tax=Phormidium sp. CCY1219 TaxID=2886104 RepID=UPI002D780C24|nr:FAD-dependent oxidoreductase [Phormidium sp. CCY1219]
MTDSPNPTVILGGGFTGLFTAIHLVRQNYEKPIVLIDRNSRFTFQPLLYEFLTEEMTAEQVCPHYEKLLSGKEIKFVRDTVEAIDLPEKNLCLASGLTYTYDHLVLALGSIVNYFGVEGARENALTFRNQADALALREHLRDCLQRASMTEDAEKRRALLTVALGWSVGCGISRNPGGSAAPLVCDTRRRSARNSHRTAGTDGRNSRGRY